MTSDQELRSLIDRIIRVKDEVRDLNADIREIYREAKSAGFDKTALGKVVNYIEKRGADAAKVAESDAIFDLYLCAYDGKVGTGNAPRAHVHEAVESSERGHHAEESSTADSLPSQPPAGGDAENAGNNSNSDSDETAAVSTPPGSVAEEIPAQSNSPEAENPSHASTLLEARMPRESSAVLTSKKGRKLPVPGAENNRYARTQSNDPPAGKDDNPMPDWMRRGGHKANNNADGKGKQDTLVN